jgi:outer membrane protein assembly factor BamD
MKYLLNAIAQHEVHVANYYFKKGAYLAAANRAQYAITQYQGTPSTKEALLILTRSYDALGMTQLRDDAKRVLNANYPKDDKEDTNKIEKSWWQFW